MVNVLTSITIQRPLSVVSAFASDPDNASIWYDNIESAVWKTARPLAVGSRIAFVAHFLGREMSYTYEIIELIPGEKLVMRTAEGPFPMETTYTWTPVSENVTKMSLRNQGKPSGFSKLFAPFMSLMMRRANIKDLKKLKNILEQDPAAGRTAGW